ncbi:MAG: hypothetical protein SVS15_04140 [Thermodesulfobacteriota bacterium]|nr:hypothetical protein [Thermodesulfobacteriota bacterium]
MGRDFAIIPGSIFLTRNPMALSRGINAVQRVWSKDHKSKYSHAGILIDEFGTTFESLWTVKSQNLFKAYAGCQVLIAHNDLITERVFRKAYEFVHAAHHKDFYPFYRLIFHIIPPLAKLSAGNVVCSELAAKYLWQAEVLNFYNGCNPNDLHHMVCFHGHWIVDFEGML